MKNWRMVALIAVISLPVAVSRAVAAPAPIGLPAACAAVVTYQGPPEALAERAAVDPSLGAAVVRCFAELTGADVASAMRAAEADPTLCQVLIAAAYFLLAICALLCHRESPRPGIPGVVEINEQGDVFVLGEPFWDCPPYDSR